MAKALIAGAIGALGLFVASRFWRLRRDPSRQDAAETVSEADHERLLRDEANRLCERVRRLYPDMRILSPGVQKLPLILEHSNFLSSAHVESLLAIGRTQDGEGKFEPSVINGGVNRNKRDSDSIFLTQDDLMDDIAQRVGAILDVKPEYVCNQFSRALLLRYKPSASDNSVGVNTHTDFSEGWGRIYTCLIYLTNHPEGDGVTTFKPDSFGDVSLSVRPARGKMIIFRVGSRNAQIMDPYADHCASGLRLSRGSDCKFVCQIFVKGPV